MGTIYQSDADSSNDQLGGLCGLLPLSPAISLSLPLSLSLSPSLYLSLSLLLSLYHSLSISLQLPL